jgi:hypothetical protein
MSRGYYNDDSFFFDFLIPIIVVAAIVGGIFTGIAQIIEASDHDYCHEKGDLASVQVTYRKWKGCYVNDAGVWVPFDNWRYNKDHGYVRQPK